MKKIALVMLMFLVMCSICYGETSIALTDDTLVTSDTMLKCLAKSQQKALVVTGTVADTFAIYEDGVLVKTITLAATSEKWTSSHTVSTFKVNWTLAGAGGATLYCY